MQITNNILMIRPTCFKFNTQTADNNFYQRVQKGFLKLANKNKKKYQIINSNLDMELNELKIIKRINDLI